MIDKFVGEYHFLSNFHVDNDGKTVEHKFQAAKSESQDVASWVMCADTPGLAKMRGRSVLLRSDWELVKIPIMAKLVAEKFKDPTLKAKLLKTRIGIPQRKAAGVMVQIHHGRAVWCNRNTPEKSQRRNLGRIC